MKKQIKKIPQFEIGSENVFADLGFKNPEEEQLKADLTGEIAHLIKKKRLTQAQAAKILGVDQPRVSSLLNGRLDLFSLEMLMQFLQTLGQDIEIKIKPKPRNRKIGLMSVSFSGRVSVPIAAKSR